MLRAQPKNLSTWAHGKRRCRHDYDSNDHLLEHMLNSDYFGSLWAELGTGDYITITDSAGGICKVRVDAVDKAVLKVELSLVEKLVAKPVTKTGADEADDGYCLRHRGPRYGWAIVNSDGEIIAEHFPRRDDAMKALAVMRETGEFKALPGHEPKQAAA